MMPAINPTDSVDMVTFNVNRKYTNLSAACYMFPADAKGKNADVCARNFIS